jgi:DNA repair exonuclease SbcCD ATPase subunit
MAIEAGDDADLDASDPAQAPTVAEGIVPALRDIMTAQTNLAVRVKNAKLIPAEKHLLIALANTIKARLGDELREVELVRAELVERAAAPEAGTKEAAAVKQMADCAAAANNALKPVKKLIDRLSNAATSQRREPGEILAALRDLHNALAEADDTVARNFAHIEALATDDPRMIGEYVEKFGRWRGQLSTLAGETERLARVTTAAAALALALTTAAALEKGIADTLRPLAGKKVKAEVLVPIRERCAQSLATIAQHLQQVRNAREALAEATKTPWRILKTASEYLKGHAAEIDALETELKNRNSRIEKLRNLVLR